MGLTKKEAEKAATETLKLMRGKGWKKHIWENMGWHASVYNGGLWVSIEVYCDGTVYSAMVSSDGHLGAGNGCWTVPGRKGKKDPNKAAEIAVKDARKQLSQCLAKVETAEAVLGIKPKEPKKRKKK